jgi:hypothetical protein
MHATSRHHPALRKAAIVIATLDSRSADSLLDKMPPETAAHVRELMVELDDVPAAEQDAVLREFMMAGGSAGNDALDGIVWIRPWPISCNRQAATPSTPVSGMAPGYPLGRTGIL